eukprot:gene15950-24398_t
MASSSLQQQLAKLAGGHRHETRLRKVASFLFNDDVAQEVSAAQCLKIGQRGLRGLAQLDSRFNHFHATLFDDGSLETDRMTMTPSAAAIVDNELELFLWLLSPHFLLSCAHEALEYLLRHYEVHLVMPESVLRMALPYHDHIYFPRVLQFLPLRNTQWAFLGRLQREGATLHRVVLVEHMLTDSMLFTAVSEWVNQACERAVAHVALLNLYCGVAQEICGALMSKGKKGHGRLWFVSSVAGTAEKLCQAGKTADEQAAGLVCIAILAATSPLEAVLAQHFFRIVALAAIESAAKRPGPPVESTVKLLALVSCHLPKTVEFSKSFITKLLHFRWHAVAPLLQRLQEATEGCHFLAILFRLMIRDAIATSGRRSDNLKTLLQAMRLTPALAKDATKFAFSEIFGADGPTSNAEKGVVAASVLHTIEASCPAGFDAGLQSALTDATDDAQKENVFAWMKQTFRGTQYETIADGDGNQCALTVAALHHSSAVRRRAITEIMDQLLGSKREDGRKAEFVAVRKNTAASHLLHVINVEEDASVLSAIFTHAAGLTELYHPRDLSPVIIGLLCRTTHPKPVPSAPLAAACLTKLCLQLVRLLSASSDHDAESLSSLAADVIPELTHTVYRLLIRLSRKGTPAADIVEETLSSISTVLQSAKGANELYEGLRGIGKVLSVYVKAGGKARDLASDRKVDEKDTAANMKTAADFVDAVKRLAALVSKGGRNWFFTRGERAMKNAVRLREKPMANDLLVREADKDELRLAESTMLHCLSILLPGTAQEQAAPLTPVVSLFLSHRAHANLIFATMSPKEAPVIQFAKYVPQQFSATLTEPLVARFKHAYLYLIQTIAEMPEPRLALDAPDGTPADLLCDCLRLVSLCEATESKRHRAVTRPIAGLLLRHVSGVRAFANLLRRAGTAAGGEVLLWLKTGAAHFATHPPKQEYAELANGLLVVLADSAAALSGNAVAEARAILAGLHAAAPAPLPAFFTHAAQALKESYPAVPLKDCLEPVFRAHPAALKAVCAAAVAAGEGRVATLLDGLSGDPSLAQAYLPLLGQVADGAKKSLSADEALLTAAAVGSLRALWAAAPPAGKAGKKPAEKKKAGAAPTGELLAALCACFRVVAPVPVEGRVVQKWAFAAQRDDDSQHPHAEPAPGAVSLPDLVCSALTTPDQEPVDGFAELYTSLSQSDADQFLEALLVLTSSGHAAGRVLAKSLAPLIAGGVLAHAAQFALRWRPDLKETARTGAQLQFPRVSEGNDNGGAVELLAGSSDSESDSETELRPNGATKRKAVTDRKSKSKRANDGGAQVNAAVEFSRVVEMLVLLHPGSDLGLVKGQDPIVTGAFAWHCLRHEASKSQLEGRNDYIIRLFVTLLANSASEVALCVRHWQEAHPQQKLEPSIKSEELIPGIAAAPKAKAGAGSFLLQPRHGLLLADFDELVELLRASSSSSVRAEGMRVFRSLLSVSPVKVYTACLHFVIKTVGVSEADDLLHEILTHLIPGLLSNEEHGSHLITLIHVVLYSYASRRGSSEAALDGCHDLLSRCNVHYQLIALSKLLSLTVADPEVVPAEQEEILLRELGRLHPSNLTGDQIGLRVVLFALRHVTSDAFIEAVLDEEEATAGSEDPRYYESFTNLFLCLLKLYRQHGGGEEDESRKLLRGGSGSDGISSERLSNGSGRKDSGDDDEEDEEGSDGSSASSALSDARAKALTAAGTDVPDADQEDLYDLTQATAVHRARQLLVAVVDVMPTPVFVAAVQELLSDKTGKLLSLGLRLFNSKLDALGESITDEDSLAFITMLPELKDVLDAAEMPSDAEDPEAALAETALPIQSALWTLEILSRHLAPLHPKSFTHFLPSLQQLLASLVPLVRLKSPAACAIASSAVLTLGHICHEIEALTLEHLPVVMPVLLDVSETAAAAAAVGALSKPSKCLKLLVDSCCAAAAKILRRIARFLSPYFGRLARMATSKGAAHTSHTYAEKLLNTLLEVGDSRLLFESLTEKADRNT